MENGTVVVVSVRGNLKYAVDPKTRKCTAHAQQFEATFNDNGFALRILPLNEYVENPVRVEVDSERFY